MKTEESTTAAKPEAKTEAPKTRMHSLELKGKGMKRPTTGGTHRVKSGKLEAVAATANPLPFADLAGNSQADTAPATK